MNCTTAKKMFSEAFDDRLTAPVRRRFEEHVAECDPCDAAFRDYQALFSAVRSMPSTHTDRPAPMPRSAGSFIVRRVSRVSRRAVAAAIIVLVAGASFAGFEFGKSNHGAEVAETPEVAELELPSKPCGKALRRTVNSYGTTTGMLELAARDPEPRTIAAVSRAVGELPLHDDAVRLTNMDSDSLGSFTEPIHDFAHEVLWLQEHVIEAMHSRPGDAAELIAEFRRRRELRGVERKVTLMRKITRPYDIDPLPVRRPGEVGEDHFTRAVIALVGEQHDVALQHLSRQFESAELSRLAQALQEHLRGLGIRHGRSIRFERLELPSMFWFEDLDVRRADGKVELIIRNRDGEVHIEHRKHAPARPKKRL